MPVTTRYRNNQQHPRATTTTTATTPATPTAILAMSAVPSRPSRKRSSGIEFASEEANVVSPEPISLDGMAAESITTATTKQQHQNEPPRPKGGKRRKQSPPSPRSSSSSPQPQKGDVAATAAAPPQDWLEVYSLVQELRQDRTAPCDSMGCEAVATRDEKNLPNYRFQVLVALLLSSQTKDAVVADAIQRMKNDGFLTIESLRRPDITADFLANNHLAKVGFRNNKAKYLKEIVELLHQNYNSDIPPTAPQMMELPGIGPKMAYICESVAWDPDAPSGIGVDTHMHRLFNQLGWVKAAKTPEQTRMQLERWLPIEHWKTVNLLWVGFGQEVQQEKHKILSKALACSRPAQALRLLQRCGLDLKKEGTKYDMYTDIQTALKPL